MLALFQPKQKSTLGVDISPTGLNLVELSCSAKAISLAACLHLPLPANAVESPFIRQPVLLSDRIAQITRRCKSKVAAVAIPDANVLIKTQRLNRQFSQDSIEEALLIEAEQWLCCPAEEISLDFVIQGASSNESPMQEVLVVAAQADYINARVELLQGAGLQVKWVDVESFAIQRAIDFLHKPHQASFASDWADKDPAMLLALGLALKGVRSVHA